MAKALELYPVPVPVSLNPSQLLAQVVAKITSCITSRIHGTCLNLQESQQVLQLGNGANRQTQGLLHILHGTVRHVLHRAVGLFFGGFFLAV